jgi:hypothetical protein
LRTDLGVLLDGDVLVGFKGGDSVVGDLSTGLCQHCCGEVQALGNVREAFDESELVDNLAALVGDVLLGCVELLLGSVLLESDLGQSV